MNEHIVHHTEPTSREDLKHTDTMLVESAPESADPAGYEQSINPLGEVPPATEATTPAEEDAPIADRVGRDPSNLGDDIPDQGDVVHPAPMNAPVGKAPGM